MSALTMHATSMPPCRACLPLDDAPTNRRPTALLPGNPAATVAHSRPYPLDPEVDPDRDADAATSDAPDLLP